MAAGPPLDQQAGHPRKIALEATGRDARSQLDALYALMDGETFDCRQLFGGYSDIGVGTQVRVTDATGTLVGSAPLHGGTLDQAGCHFTFEVTVRTADIYDFEVSCRGRIAVSHEELERAGFEVSLRL